MTSLPSKIPPNESWPIHLYRYTPATGWELYQSSSEPHSILCTPKKNCVEIKKLRLRIHLFAQSSNKAIDQKNEQEEKSPRNHDSCRHATVVQRQDTILITSSRGNIGAVVLKFPSLTDCHSFSDYLVRLNANSPATIIRTDLNPCDLLTTTGADPATLSYLIQMLQDPNFLQLIQYMDTMIQSIPGGNDMLRALALKK